MNIDMQIAEAQKHLMDAEIDLLNMKRSFQYQVNSIESQSKVVTGLKAKIEILQTLKSMNYGL
jgi:hypothetical protein